MATFQYEAINTKNGKTENGELPAASQAEALARLQEMGLAPTKVEQAKAAGRLVRRRQKERNRLTKPKKFLIIFVVVTVAIYLLMAGRLDENPNIPPILSYLCMILIGICTAASWVISSHTNQQIRRSEYERRYVKRDATGKIIEYAEPDLDD